MKHTCVIVAAGNGSRMNSNIPKQYILINDYPVLYYTIKAIEDSFIDDIILVVPAGDEEYIKTEFVKKYHFQKVTAVVAGGSQRYESVYNGLSACKDSDYVYIQDGARPFANEDMLLRVKEGVEKERAVVAAVPVKDTIKEADESGYGVRTLDRNKLWAIQTPQAFEYELIFDAYKTLESMDKTKVTDDACVVEMTTDVKVKFVMGDYENIKITTPEDLAFAKSIIQRSKK